MEWIWEQYRCAAHVEELTKRWKWKWLSIRGEPKSDLIAEDVYTV